jgi:hypothetical protein
MRLLGPPPVIQQEYYTLIHASDGLFAIRSIGPYWTVQDHVVTVRHKEIGPTESFLVIDPNYPPPLRPSTIDLSAIHQEAILDLNFDDRSSIENQTTLHNVRIDGGSAYFGGVDSCMEIKLKTPIDASSFSILFRMCYESYERGGHKSYWLSQVEDGKETFSLRTNWGRLTWYCNGEEIALSRGEFQLHKWHHVAVVVDGKRNNIYVDGFPQRNGSCRVTPGSAASLWIGRSATGERETFCHGRMKDVMILNRPLSPKEVRSIAHEA